MTDSNGATRKLYLLGLAAATHTFAAAIPFSCMPVLFEEMSADLGLSLVQIGLVWSMAGLAGVLVALIGGFLGDRFGVKRVLGLACILGGFVGALRGLSTGFISLTIIVFVFGILRAIMPVNVHKAVSIWFQGRNLGTANGVVSMGMGIGLMLGSMISATMLSPLLGGWRHVFFLYGAVSVVVGVFWLLSGSMPRPEGYRASLPVAVPMRRAVSKLIRIKGLWLMGVILMCRSGCIMGMVGYLPLYLRERGWEIAQADGTLAGFFAISTLLVIPISILSDRTGSRKAILFIGLATALFGIGLLPLANGIAVWLLVLSVGMFIDAFMSIALTLVLETKGIGIKYSGTALGLVFTFAQLGSFMAPPIGNSLAQINSGLPLIFWASLSIVAAMALIFAKETTQE